MAEDTEQETTSEATAESEAPTEKKKVSLTGAFLRLSGYTKEDIFAYSAERRTVVTKNGGKYLVSKTGRQLKVLAGPMPPAFVEEAEQEE